MFTTDASVANFKILSDEFPTKLWQGESWYEALQAVVQSEIPEDTTNWPYFVDEPAEDGTLVRRYSAPPFRIVALPDEVEVARYGG